MIPASFTQELLSRVDLVELVGRHVTLKKVGSNFMGLCPFHGEKSPSFSVSSTRQRYHCFGCGVGGDAIEFLVQHTGATFREAVADLASTVGLNVPDEEAEDPRAKAEAALRKAKSNTLVDVMEKAAAAYRAELKKSTRAIDYLKGRGLTGTIAARFGLGYAPEGRRHLATVFPAYDDPLLEEAGLVIVRERQASAPIGSADADATAADAVARDPAEVTRYDRFRDRVMFPIRDQNGQVIAFGGRVLDRGEPKYLNSPETPLFVKGRELYGLFEGKKAMRERGYALVVEGYMDVVALAQWGLANAVATLGTACTDEHVRKLMRFSDTVVFSFDGDAAGRRAAVRALQASLPHASDTRSFKFLFLPPEHDPDTYVREQGVESFESLVHASVPLSKQLVEVACEGCDLGVSEGRARMLSQAKPLWLTLPQGALKTQLLRELATLGALTADEVLELWRVAPDGAGQRTSARQDGPRAEGRGLDDRSNRWRENSRATNFRGAAPRKPLRGPADNVARLLVLQSAWWDTLSEAERDILSRCEGWHGALFGWLERALQDTGPQPWAALQRGLADEPFAPELNALMAATDAAFEPLEADLHRAIEQLFSGAPFKLPGALPGPLPHG